MFAKIHSLYPARVVSAGNMSIRLVHSVHIVTAVAVYAAGAVVSASGSCLRHTVDAVGDRPSPGPVEIAEAKLDNSVNVAAVRLGRSPKNTVTT
jgi:hypothetical protein